MNDNHRNQSDKSRARLEKFFAAINIWWLCGALLATAFILRAITEITAPPNHVHVIGPAKTNAVGTSISKKDHPPDLNPARTP